VYGADWSCKAPIKLVHAAYAKSKQQQHEEVVVLSKVLAADINLGYQDIGNIQVLAVNGTKVSCLGLSGAAVLTALCHDSPVLCCFVCVPMGCGMLAPIDVLCTVCLQCLVYAMRSMLALLWLCYAIPCS
jgi:hypothetical protein